MHFYCSKRTLVRIITFFLALILTLSLLLGIRYLENRSHQREREYGYLQSVEDLYGYLSSISSTLTKGTYCASPNMLSTFSALLWRDAGFAKEALTSLPVKQFELENTFKFISQVGDYAVNLSKKIREGESLTEDEIKTLRSMKNYCGELLGELFVLQEIVRQGGVDYGSVGSYGEEDFTDFGGGFKNFEESLGEFPSLIYDGPFSDHILQKEPVMLKGQTDVSREQARTIAAKAAGVDRGSLIDGGDEEGKMPSYCFSTEDRSVSIGVTKSGGFITYCLQSRPVGEQALSIEEGLEKAGEYLKKMEIRSIKHSYYEVNNGILSINYAYDADGILCYPDLIKVGVALDDGEIISFHQRGFLSNHRERKLNSPKLTQEAAAKKLSPLLTVKRCRLTVIPSEGLNELLCYEFLCEGSAGEEILVYLNTESGEEEQILILLTDEHGTLTV